MKELVSGGHSLIFVSHDLVAVEAICPAGMLLEDGRVAIAGPIREVLGRYAHLNTLASGRELRSRSLLLPMSPGRRIRAMALSCRVVDCSAGSDSPHCSQSAIRM